MRSPFVGLRPFTIGDSDIFFGRTPDIAVLRNLVLAVPVLVIYAPSGTGKSSLINAGLMPIIQRDPDLLPITISDPHEDVTAVVRRRLEEMGWEEAGWNGVKPGTEGLAGMLERHFEATDRRVVLILDQFEERFKQAGLLDALYAEVARLANTRSIAATVVISLREDHLAGLEGLMARVSGLLDASYRVPGLSRAALVDAVRCPLKALDSDVEIEEDLIDEVLDDLQRTHRPESPDGYDDGRIEAGYFQIVWAHLWEKEAKDDKGQLTRATYYREGRADGILKSFVEKTLSQLLPLEAEVLRAAIRYMVLPSGAKIPLTIEDMLGMLRLDDMTMRGGDLLFAEGYYSGGERSLTDDQKKIVHSLLESLLQYLTRTDAPLFRRALRGGREEFELVHDLLGKILLDWRLRYEEVRVAATLKVGLDVFRADKHFPSSGQPRIFWMSQSRVLNTAIDQLSRYRLGLPALDTAESAEKHGRILRSALIEASGTAVFDSRDFRYALHEVVFELRIAALGNPSRGVRGVLQLQAFGLLEVLEFLSRRSGYVLSGLTLTFAWIVGFFFSGGGILMARWLIGKIWHVPDVQYFPLIMSVIAVAGPFLYALAYDANAKQRTDWVAARKALWPLSDTMPVGRYRYLLIFVWWPILFIVHMVACFVGAELFQLAGWSPTAGFTLAALVLSIGLAIAYSAAADF